MRIVQVYEKDTGTLLASIEETEDATCGVLRDGLAVRVDGENLKTTGLTPVALT